MNTYEAMVIFPESLNDEELEAVLEKVRGEMTKLGGQVGSVTRLGRRPFARKLKKQLAGHYFVIAFQMDGAKLAALQSKLKLNESVFRVQIVRQISAAPKEQVAAAKG